METLCDTVLKSHISAVTGLFPSHFCEEEVSKLIGAKTLRIYGLQHEFKTVYTDSHTAC